jgi:hypothetical protein
MGTRSVTIIMNEHEQELCRVYRQFDGYPEGHGKDLAALCDREITDGISGTSLYKGLDKNGLPIRAKAEEYTTSNGISELAAQIITGLKNEHPVGNIYLEIPQGDISRWAEYIYIVRGKEGEKPTIECRTQTGDFPFNIQTETGLVFKGTAKEWLEKEEFTRDW